MALQNKLKAFVRFDGSGRVIPSSLILQKSKPKVGNWKEINATECCNSAPTTTTTTTADPRPRISSLACGPLLPYQEITIVNGDSICDPMIYITGDFSQVPQGPFYVNVGSIYRMFSPMGNQAYPMGNCETCVPGTTVFTKPYWLNSSDACSTTTFGELLFFSSSSTFQAGISVFQNAELTIPVQEGYVFSEFMFKYIVGANGVLSVYECSTTTTSTSTSTTTTTAAPLVYGDYEASRFTQFLCPPNTGVVINMGIPNGNISTASIIYAAFSPTYFTPDEVIYVKFDQLGITYTKQFTINSVGDAAIATGSQVPC